MYGNGIGTLTVSITDTRENQERDIWTLHGEAGNAWYQAEVPVSNANPFKVFLNELYDVILQMFSIVDSKP